MVLQHMAHRGARAVTNGSNLRGWRTTPQRLGRKLSLWVQTLHLTVALVFPQPFLPQGSIALFAY